MRLYDRKGRTVATSKGSMVTVSGRTVDLINEREADYLMKGIEELMRSTEDACGA